MHEYSIVSALIQACEKQAQMHHAKAIKAIDIDVGRLSGIEVHFLEQSFDLFKEETCCAEATLNIHVCDVVVECKRCGVKSTLEKNHFICQGCHSDDVVMIQGQELLIKSIEIIEETYETI